MEPVLLSTAQVTAWIGGFFWPLARIAAMFSIVPVIGGRQVPRNIRMVLALLITLTILPLRHDIPGVEPWSPDGVLITLQQILIGLSMGFIMTLVFHAVTLAGANIAMTMGLGFAVFSDPMNGGQSPVISQLLSIIASLLFLALNGHLALIEMVATSFTRLPIATSGLGPDGLWLLLEWARHMFSGAVMIALPAVAALLSVNITMGVMTRAAPQLNIFSVGFPLTMLAGFVAILITLPNLLPIFEGLFTEAMSEINAILAGER